MDSTPITTHSEEIRALLDQVVQIIKARRHRRVRNREATKEFVHLVQMLASRIQIPAPFHFVPGGYASWTRKQIDKSQLKTLLARARETLSRGV